MNIESRLFVKEDGKPYSNSKALGKVISNIAKRVGLNYSSHSLRRKFSQDLVFNHNVPLPIVAQALGHSPGDIKTLMTSYCLVRDNQSVEVLKNLD